MKKLIATFLIDGLLGAAGGFLQSRLAVSMALMADLGKIKTTRTL